MGPGNGNGDKRRGWTERQWAMATHTNIKLDTHTNRFTLTQRSKEITMKHLTSLIKMLLVLLNRLFIIIRTACSDGRSIRMFELKDWFCMCYGLGRLHGP